MDGRLESGAIECGAGVVMWNVTVSTPGCWLAFTSTCLSDPAPLSFVFVTSKVPAGGVVLSIVTAGDEPPATLSAMSVAVIAADPDAVSPTLPKYAAPPVGGIETLVAKSNDATRVVVPSGSTRHSLLLPALMS